MRIEQHNGHNIVCGHIYPTSEVKVGQRWMASGGAIVTVCDKQGDWITYYWYEGDVRKEHEKQCFAFQCRYCLIVE